MHWPGRGAAAAATRRSASGRWSLVGPGAHLGGSSVRGGPPERRTQIGEFGGEPGVGIALPGAVPQGHDVGFTPGEVASMGGPYLGGLAARNESVFGELADRLQHRTPGPPRRPMATSSDLLTKAS